MPRFAQPLIESGFASGVTRFDDHYPGYEQSARVVIEVYVESRYLVPAIVDTGAPWCVLDPEIARQLQVIGPVGYDPTTRLIIRQGAYEGRLLKLNLSLQAEEGDDLLVDATVFVPTLRPGEPWPHPNFIGLDGFLCRIRFAVDASDNAFYFGPL